MCMFSNGENHTAACDPANRASTTASSSTPSSGGDNGGNGGSTAHAGAPTVHHLCRIQGCVRRATGTEHGNRTQPCAAINAPAPMDVSTLLSAMLLTMT